MKLQKILIILCVFLISVTPVSLILARAGGGHGFQSSGGGFSGGSNGSGLGGGGFFFGSGGGYYGGSRHVGSSRGEIPFIFLIIVVIGIYLVYNYYKSSKSEGTGATGNETGDAAGNYLSGGESPQLAPAPDLSAKLQQLHAKDSGFNEQVFHDRVSTAFFEIQHAWVKRDMNPARALISDSVWQRFNLQLEEYATKNWYNQLDELSLDRIVILDLRSDEHYDTIDVWLTATARDYVTDHLGHIVSGSTELRTWDEKWSFVRTLKAQTTVTGAVTAGIKSNKCPNCGSPVQSNAGGECEYCHSSLTKYDFDWILSEITQLDC